MVRFAALLIGMLLATAPTAAAAVSECTRENGPAPKPGPALDSRIELTVEPASDVVNFAGKRGMKQRDFVVTPKGDASFPESLTADQIELRTVRQFNRIGDKRESVTLEQPVRFTQPEVDADEIRFAVCLDLEDADAGTYLGQIRVAGPRGLERASATITVNAQDRSTFMFGLIAALLVAFVVLLVRKLVSKQPLIKFVPLTLLSLGAAGYAMYKVYAGDPAWGADGTEAVIALILTGLSAAGLKVVADTITPGNKG